MEQEFDDIALDIDPDSIPLNANGAPMKTDSPTATNDTRIGLKNTVQDDANNEGKLERSKKFLSLHNRAIEQTKIEDINMPKYQDSILALISFKVQRSI